MNFLTLYIHILLASVWIGGMIILIGFIIYTKGAKSEFFYKFTTFYGYLNIAVLTFLVMSGIVLIYLKGLYYIIFENNSISCFLWAKITLVFLMVLATIYHTKVVLQSSKRSRVQNTLSKISSFYLLISSMVVLYIAMHLRDLL